MSINNLKIFFIFALFLSLFNKTIAITNIKISPSTNEQNITIEGAKKLYLEISDFESSSGKFIYFSFESINNSNLDLPEKNVYFTYDNTTPSKSKYDYKITEITQNEFYIPVPINFTKGNILIQFSEKITENYNLKYKIVSQINTILYLNDDKIKRIQINDTNSYTLIYSTTINQRVIISIIGKTITNFNAGIQNNNNEVQSLKRLFFNGYGKIIESKTKEDIKIFVNVDENSNINEFIEIKVRTIIENVQIQDETTINFDYFYDTILDTINDEECFNLPEEVDYNLILNCLTFTPNNILINLQNGYNSENVNLNKESLSIDLSDNLFNKICFKSIDKSKDAAVSFYVSSYGLDDDEDDEITVPNYFYLVRGVNQNFILKDGFITYYKIKNYNEYNEYNINFHSINGNSKLYITNCEDYPKCYHKEKDLKELYEYESVNGYIYINKPKNEGDEENLVALIYCKSESDYCEYNIEMKNENDLSYLNYENYLIFSDISNYKLYEFQNINETNKKSMININTINGNINYKIYTDKFCENENKNVSYSIIGNKKLITIPSNTNSEILYLKIQNTDYNSAYFSINFEIENNSEIYLNNGIEHYDYLIINEQASKKYVWGNLEKSTTNKFVVNINTYGNKLKFNYQGKTENSSENDNFKQIYFSNAENNIYTLEISTNENEVNKKLLFSIEGHEVINDKIIINNGIEYTNILNKENSEIYYSALFAKNNYDNNELLININKKSNDAINLTLNNDYKFQINSLNKVIYVNHSTYDKICDYENNDICEIKIKVTSQSLSSNNFFNIEMKFVNSSQSPIYLEQNKIHTNKFSFSNTYQYYYFDVNSELENDILIYIDFFEGFSNAIAKIVNKNIIEENNDFNGRVLLPKNDITDKNLKYDNYNKYFRITNNLLKDCLNDSCEIYIGIYNNLENIEKKNNNIYKYNIYSLHNNNNQLNLYIPENEYIFGKLQDSIEQNYYTKIFSKTNRILITLNCPYCTLDIFIDVNDLKSSIKYSTNKGDNYQILIEASSLNLTTLYGVTFNLVIKNSDISIIKEQNYNFRVLSVGIQLPIIQNSKSLYNEYCTIEKEKNCYFMIPIENYKQYTNIKLFVPNNKNVIISGFLIDMDEFENDKGEDLITELLNTNDIYNFTSKNNFNTNYINYKINLEEMPYSKTGYYCIINVENDYTDNIMLISSIFDNNYNDITVNIPFNEYLIYNLNNENNKINFLLDNSEKGLYNLEIGIINGDAKVTYKEVNYIIDEELKNSINLIMDNEEIKNDNNIFVEINDSMELVFYIRYVLSDNNDNLIELNFQKNNYINYIISDSYISKNDITLNYFMKLNISSENENINDYSKNIHFNYKFNLLNQLNNNKENTIEDCTNNLFKTEIYIVDKSYIIKRKSTTTTKPDSSNLLQNYFQNYKPDLSIGYSLITYETIKKYSIDDNYLYIIISPTEINKNIYNNSKLIITVTPFDLSENSFLPQNEYLTMFINNNAQKILLGRNHNENGYIDIQLIKENSIYDFLLLPENDTESPKNVSEINLNETKHNGKNIIKSQYLTNETKYNLIKIIKKTEDSKSAFIFLKYLTMQNNNIINYYYLSSDTIKISYENSEKDMNLSLKFNPVQYDDSPNLNNEFSVIYNVLIYKKSSIILSNTIFESKAPFKIYKYKPNLNEKEINIEINNLPYKDYYINIIAEVNNLNLNNKNNSKLEYISYETVLLEVYDEKKNENINIKNELQSTTGSNATYYLYEATFNPEDGNYIKLDLINNDSLYEYNHIFVSTEKKEKLIYSDSDYKTIERSNSLIIPVSEISNYTVIYIGIECKNICDYVLQYQISFDINLKETSDNFDVKIVNDETYLVYKRKKDNKTHLFTLTFDNVNMLKDNLINSITPLFSSISFYNGISFSFNDNVDYLSNDAINITIQNIKINEIIHITHKVVSTEKISIVPGDTLYNVVSNEYIKEVCFNLFDDKKEDTDDYILTIITGTKNLIINFNNDTSNEFQINSETTNYAIKPDIYNEFCIRVNKDDISDGYGGVIIHLTAEKKNSNNDEQYLNFPLIKGIYTSGKIKKNHLLYYRINSNSYDNKYLDIYFQRIQGNPKIYYTKCENYPECNFTSNDTKNLSEIKLIVDNIHLKKNIDKFDIYYSHVFPILLVYCEDSFNENYCDFNVGMSNENDMKIINNNQRIHSFINKDETQLYQINLNFNQNNLVLYIQVSIITGNVEFNVKDSLNQYDVGNYEFYNNNNTKYFVTKKITSGENRKLNINITGLEVDNSYYNIFYYIFNDINTNDTFIQSGVVFLSRLSYNEGEIYFVLKNKNTNMMAINSPNCYFDYSYNNIIESKLINYQNIYLLSENNEGFKFKVNINNIDIPDSDGEAKNNKCILSVSSMEITNKTSKELLLYNNLYQYNKLDSYLTSIKYCYLIQHDSNNDDTITIHIKKQNKHQKLKIYYGFNDENLSNSKNIYGIDEIIIVPKNSTNNNNNNENIYNYDLLKIQITCTEDVINTNEFGIMISTGNIITKYLYRDNIDYNLITSKQYQYYFYEFFKDQTKIITIDFKGNEDKIKSKLYIQPKKLDINENNKNKNVFLPTPDDETSIEIDNFTSRYQINCGSAICEVCILIYLLNDKNQNYYPYNIYIDNFINANEDLYINGLLTDNNIVHNYYLSFYYETASVIFYVNCFDCILDIKLKGSGKDESYSLYSFEKTFIDENFVDMKSVEYSIRKNSENKLISSNDSMFYSLKLSIHKSSILLVTNINENIFFNLLGSKYYLVPIQKLNFIDQKENKLLFFAPNFENLEIRAKIINMSDFEEKDDEEKAKYIDNINDFDWESSLSTISNKLLIDITDFMKDDENKYILLSLNRADTNETKGNLINQQIITTENENKNENQKFLLPNNYKIISIQKSIENNKTILIYKNETLYKFDIQLIEGSGIITISSNNELVDFYLGYDIQEKFIYETRNIQYLTAFKNEQSDNFTFYISFTEQYENDNLDEIIFQKMNYYMYQINKENTYNKTFEINLYMKLVKLDPRNNIFINIMFNNIIYKNITTNDFTNESFDIKVYSVEEDFINKRRNHTLTDVKYNDTGSKTYHKDLRRALIFIPSNQLCNEDKCYLYIIIQPNNLNNFIYEKFNLDVAAFDSNEKLYTFPRGKQFLEFIANNNDKLLLKKSVYDHKIFDIELLNTNSDIFSFSIGGFNTSLDYSSNETECINKTKSKEYGEHLISINENRNDVNYVIKFINLNEKKNNNENVTIFMKYISSNNESNLNYYKLNDKTISYKNISKNIINISHKNILKTNTKCSKTNYNLNDNKKNFNISYIIRLYDLNAYFEEKTPSEIVNKIDPVYIYRKYLNEKELCEDNIEYSIELNDELEYYVNILAEVIEETNIEYFVFDTIKIKENKEISYTSWMVFLSSLCVMCLTFILYLIQRKLKKNSKKNNSMMEYEPVNVNENENKNDKLIN